MSNIKNALINPMEIFNSILNIELPNEYYIYLNTLYTTLKDLFEILFDYNQNERNLQIILDKYNITDEMINSINDTRYGLESFMNLIRVIKFDLFKLQSFLVIHRVKNSQADDIFLNMNKLFKHMVINPETFMLDAKKISIFYSENLLTELGEYLNQSISVIMISAYSPESINRLWEDLDMSKKMKKSDRIKTDWYKDEDGSVYFDIGKYSTIEIDESPTKKDLELTKEINKFDKQHGCKLKEPKPTLDDEDDFDKEVNEYKVFLAKTLFLINKVSAKKKIVSTIFGQELRKINIDSKFKDKSKWFDNAEVDAESRKFKLRFMSYIILWLIKNIKKISEICYAVNKDGEFIEYEEKIEYIEYMVEKTIDVINKIMNGEELNQDLLYFQELIIYANMPENKVKKNIKKIDSIYKQSSFLDHNLERFSFYSQDISMDTLLKLSYMVSTNEWDVKGVIDFKQGYKFKNVNDTKIMIEQLGKSIRKIRNKTGIPELIKFFIKSNPIVSSRWKDINDNKNLVTGVVALQYFSFLANFENIKRVVEGIS